MTPERNISRRLERRPSSLLGRGPVGGNPVSAGDPGEFFGVPLGASKLLHAFVYRIGVNGVGGIARHLCGPPAAKFIGLLADKGILVLMDVLPAEHLLRS